MTKNTRQETMKFEDALKRLEEIVQKMEQDVDLDKSLILFEEGIKLVRFCQEKLEESKKKVEILVKKGGKLASEPFDTENDGGNGKKELF
ncbi:MAG: exodeoxyribonuclease VII small subunit [Elusimicrobiota bacterium]